MKDRALRVGIVPSSFGWEWPGFAGGVVANGGLHVPTIMSSRWSNKVEFMPLDGFDARERALSGCASEGVDILWTSVQSWAAEFPKMQQLRPSIDAQAILQIARSRGACALIADSRIHSPREIRRRSLITPKFTPAHWLAQQYLDHLLHGKESQEPISLVDSNEDALTRFLSKNADADAVALCDPYVYRAMQRQGAHKLLDLDDQGEMDYILVARKEKASSKQLDDRIKDFIQVWLDGNQEFRSSPDIVAKLLFESSEVSNEFGEEFETEQEHVVMANAAENMVQFGLDGEPPRFDAVFSKANQQWHLWGLVDLSSADEAKDDHILREIYRSKSKTPAKEHLCAPNAKVLVKSRVTIHFDPPGHSNILAKYIDRGDEHYDDSLVGIAPVLNTPTNTQHLTQACIIGYTDNTGEETQNFTLSLSRARAVADYLRSAGVGRDRVIVSGRGKRNPLASNSTQEGRLMNRRAEIVILEESKDDSKRSK